MATRVENIDPHHAMPPRNDMPPMKNPMEEHHFPPGYRNSPFAPHIQQAPERYALPPNSQGAGEPHLGGSQPVMDRNDHFTHYIGPGGDHTLDQHPPLEQKHSQSPLPMVIPDDPREMEMWAQRMSEKYSDVKTQQGGKPLPEFTGRKVEKIPSLMEKFIPEPEPRRITALGSSGRGSRRGKFVERNLRLRHACVQSASGLSKKHFFKFLNFICLACMSWLQKYVME